MRAVMGMQLWAAGLMLMASGGAAGGSAGAAEAPEGPEGAEGAGEARAYFAGGCFWGMEHFFQKMEGVKAVISGYAGGSVENPTYREVCSGDTGHLEAVEVVYDPGRVSYEELARYFFEIHDPTQANGQGPDIGEQYLSAVFYQTEAEKQTAEGLIGLLREKGFDAVTQVRPLDRFWRAEEYHQDYYERKGTAPYCHGYTPRF